MQITRSSSEHRAGDSTATGQRRDSLQWAHLLISPHRWLMKKQGRSLSSSGRVSPVQSGIRFGFNNRDTNAYVIQVSSVTGTSYTPTTKLPLGEYQVTVRAISSLGDITNWSTPVSLRGRGGSGYQQTD
jgi:hypothetical protein